MSSNTEKDIYILAIESSCDETAAAVVKNGRCVLSNIISSQIELHKLYGGVVRALWAPFLWEWRKRRRSATRKSCRW